MQNKIQIFEKQPVRAIWDEEREEWYFSVVDVIGILTDSVNPTDYLKKLRKRDEQIGEYIGTNCPLVEMKTDTGKKRKTLAADTKSLFRIIQSIPSPKAEPLKLWLAQVGKERLDQLQDPELSIEQAMLDYKRNTELVLNMLAELSTKNISEAANPENFDQHMNVAVQGGEIARNARQELELKTGKPAISPLNAKSGMMIGKGDKNDNHKK